MRGLTQLLFNTPIDLREKPFLIYQEEFKDIKRQVLEKRFNLKYLLR